MVAQDVIKEVGAGRIPNKGKIQINHGYSEESARTGKAMSTKTYKKTIEPFVQRLIRHREKIIAAMENKNLDKEQYKVLYESLAKSNHDIQLLSGGKTENSEMTITWK